MGFPEFAAKCPYRLEIALERRPANALNIEISKPADRCIQKRPGHWPESCTALRWLGCGGSALVFGACQRAGCPTGQEWCPECGHRKENHWDGMCRVDDRRFPCGCEHYPAQPKG